MTDPDRDHPVPASILIVRLSAIGDIIMASGLLPSLRDAFPETHIAWLTEAGNAALLRHDPRLDRLHLWPRKRWRELRREGHWSTLAREWSGFVRELRQPRYSWVLDLQGLLKSGIWAWLAAGQRRVGLGSREGSQWLMSEVIDRSSGDPRIGREYRKLLRHLGVDERSFAPKIVVAPGTQREAAELLEASGVARPYAVIAPFTTRPQKHWFDTYWTELAARLNARTGWPVVMLGGADARSHADTLVRSGGGLIDLTGQTTLDQCAAIIEAAGLVIGVDTGLTHLGIAQGVPTLALFGSTCPYRETGRANARVLYHPLLCSPCRRHPTCNGRFDCMRLHTPDNVLAAAEELLTSNTGWLG